MHYGVNTKYLIHRFPTSYQLFTENQCNNTSLQKKKKNIMNELYIVR